MAHNRPRSSPAPALPDGLTTRPLQNSESKALFELIAAQELHDTGQVAIEEADLISDWALPGYDLGASSIGVFDGEEPRVRCRSTRRSAWSYATCGSTGPSSYDAGAVSECSDDVPSRTGESRDHRLDAFTQP